MPAARLLEFGSTAIAGLLAFVTGSWLWIFERTVFADAAAAANPDLFDRALDRGGVAVVALVGIITLWRWIGAKMEKYEAKDDAHKAALIDLIRENSSDRQRASDVLDSLRASVDNLASKLDSRE